MQEEARQDIIAAKRDSAKQASEAAEPDIEKLVENKRKQTILEEQIRDLQQLDEDNEMDGGDDSEDEVIQDDGSDADDMARIEQQEKSYESSDEE